MILAFVYLFSASFTILLLFLFALTNKIYVFTDKKKGDIFQKKKKNDNSNQVKLVCGYVILLFDNVYGKLKKKTRYL